MRHPSGGARVGHAQPRLDRSLTRDRKSTRLNSSHSQISYAVFCLKKKTYERVPYFFSDQYDAGMEYSGHAPAWDRVVFRGDPGTMEFIAFWMQGCRFIDGINVNI